jgi:hypothetical protein
MLAEGIEYLSTGRTAGAFVKNSVNNSTHLEKETSPSMN